MIFKRAKAKLQRVLLCKSKYICILSRAALRDVFCAVMGSPNLCDCKDLHTQNDAYLQPVQEDRICPALETFVSPSLPP